VRTLASGALLLVLPLLVVAGEEEIPPPPAVTHEVGVNLVKNPGFGTAVRGEKRPLGWEEPDGLTSFWEGHGRDHGYVIRLDTDVLQSEHDERREQMKLPRETRPPARKKSPTVPPKYDTVGGNKGAILRSDPIPVEQGAAYRLTFDCWSRNPQVKVWVKGYTFVPARGNIPARRRKVYQARKDVRGKTDGWETFTRVFRPTTRPGNLRGSRYLTHEIEVQLYAYWPPGEACFDNIRFEKITPEEAKKDAEEAERRAAGKTAPPGKRDRSDG
jgi:hypothetical protein